MKKIQTLLMMFSLFFLFSFSSAATVTINIIEPDGMEKTFVEDNEEVTSDVEYFLDLKSKNKPYDAYFIYFMDGKYYFMYYSSEFTGVISSPHKTGNYDVTFVGAVNNENICQTLIRGELVVNGYSSAVGDVVHYWKPYMPRLVTSNVDVYEFIPTQYSGNVNKIGYLGNVIESAGGGSDKIVMENPLTDAEIKSILEIFLESVRNTDLPEHYGRYVLSYNKVNNSYTGFVYPNYIDLGMKYGHHDDEKNFDISENSTDIYYLFDIYTEDTNYLLEFFNAIDLAFKNPLLYEFKSNSDNTAFNFYMTRHFGIGYEDSFYFSTLNQPIIYTSHKIYSLFLIGNDILGFPIFEVDENTSIENQVFIDEETGLPSDTTINDYTDSEIQDVNIFSFIKILFEFVFSIVSFLGRFFVFIISFIVVPASTTILPDGFVQGIEWIHTFAFGEILLWDIFNITFGVLLSIYLVRLINDF